MVYPMKQKSIFSEGVPIGTPPSAHRVKDGAGSELYFCLALTRLKTGLAGTGTNRTFTCRVLFMREIKY